MSDETAPIRSGKSTTAETGIRYGHVVIQRPIGAGGMGEVFLGFHEGFRLPVVVKLLPERFHDTQLVDRFLREAQVAVRLDHPNIVRVHDVGRENGRVYMIMEHLEGQDLEQYVKDRGGRLPVATALRLVAQAARGLAYAHAQGVLHRDIKPANLFHRTKDDVVKVLDFGLARAADQEQLTSPDMMMGTLPYMPLEQLKGHSVAASDVYALGVSLYRLLAGRLPASGSLEEILRYHEEGSPAPLSDLGPTPERVWTLVKRMLSKRASDRPDAARVAAELEALAQDLGPGSSTNAGRLAAEMIDPQTAPSVPASRPRRHGRRMAALVAGAAAVVALVAWHPGSHPATPRAAAGPAVPSLAASLLPLVAETTSVPSRGICKEEAKHAEYPATANLHAATPVRSGDGLRFVLRADGPLYVYVFNIDPAGSAACAFPDYYETLFADARAKGEVVGEPMANPLAPQDGEILVPPLVPSGGKQDVWWYQFDKSIGKEWFLVVASRTEVPELAALRRGLREGKSPAGDLRTLAARWEGKTSSAPATGPLGVLLFQQFRERPVGAGWCTSRGDGVIAWTMELEHK